MKKLIFLISITLTFAVSGVKAGPVTNQKIPTDTKYKRVLSFANSFAEKYVYAVECVESENYSAKSSPRQDCRLILRACLDAVELLDRILPTILGGDLVSLGLYMGCGIGYIDCVQKQ